MTCNTTLPVIGVESVRTSDELLSSLVSCPRPPFSNGPEFSCLVCTSGLGLSSDQPKMNHITGLNALLFIFVFGATVSTQNHDWQ